MADTTITPASPATWPANLVVPTPGDPVKAATPAGAVRPAYQALLNGVASAQARAYGRPTDIRIDCESNTVLTINPVGSFTVLDAGVWKTYTDVDNVSSATGGYGVVIDPSALVTLAANKRYWVYLKKPTGADPFDVFIEEQDGTPGTYPDRNFMYRAADQSANLISTFYTDHTTTILPYVQNGGLFTYKTRTAPGGGVRGNLILDAGSATSSTIVNWGDSVFTTQVPLYFFEVACSRSGTAFVGQVMLDATQAAIVLGGDGTAQVLVRQQGTAYGDRVKIYYQVDNAATDMWIWVTGQRIWSP